MDKGFGHWLAGFIDGEGCFTIQYGKSWYCRFMLGVRDDDAAIIYKIAEQTGLGNVRTKPALGTSRAQVYWGVESKADCLSLVRLLDRYPMRARKRADYLVWRDAVMAWQQQRNGRSNPEARATMARCAEYLREGRRYRLTD